MSETKLETVCCQRCGNNDSVIYHKMFNEITLCKKCYAFVKSRMRIFFNETMNCTKGIFICFAVARKDIVTKARVKKVSMSRPRF